MVLTTEYAPVEAAEPGYDTVVTPEIVDGQLLYVARHPALPRCFSQGATPDEAIENLAEVVAEYRADMNSIGRVLPELIPTPQVTILESFIDSTAAGTSVPLSVNWVIRYCAV